MIKQEKYHWGLSFNDKGDARAVFIYDNMTTKHTMSQTLVNVDVFKYFKKPLVEVRNTEIRLIIETKKILKENREAIIKKSQNKKSNSIWNMLEQLPFDLAASYAFRNQGYLDTREVVQSFSKPQCYSFALFKGCLVYIAELWEDIAFIIALQNIDDDGIKTFDMCEISSKKVVPVDIAKLDELILRLCSIYQLGKI